MGEQISAVGLAALALPPDPSCSGGVIQAGLATLRRHLGMDVAFVSTIRDGCRFFAYVDAVAGEPVTSPADLPGDGDPTEDTYCGRVIAGRIPQLILDARREPGVADLAVTTEAPIGAHLSVPLIRSTGEPMGTLCCFSHRPDETLRERDLQVLRLFADLVGPHMETILRHEEHVGRVRTRVLNAVLADCPRIALQPIVELATEDVVGHEALARFTAADGAAPGWDTARWFHEATGVGMGPFLETAAVTNALALLPMLPQEATLSVNVAAASLSHRPLVDLLASAPGVMVEITEHTRIVGYEALGRSLDRLREAGVLVAIDDVGAGYAGLEQILELAPDVIKFDRAIVTGLRDDPLRRAMTHGLASFAASAGVRLIAEGIETAEDVDALREIGVPLGQGYHLGRPVLMTANP
ncbi:EAL domain-containing protein [Nocardioides sp.]|uniref:EAL domain-containing protein n=1 Tax=Nocardioides sp. TaxID=35761 RepID=UPI002EDA745D